MIVGGVGVSDGVDAGGGGSGCGSVGCAGVVVCRRWGALCVDLMLARVCQVFCWLLGLLVLPTVRALRWMVRVMSMMYWVSLLPLSLLAAGVCAGEGVGAFGLGGLGSAIGGGAGVGVAVTGPRCGLARGWSLGIAGFRRSPLLAKGLVGAAVGLALCPSDVSAGPAALLAEGCWALVLWVFLCCVPLWCGPGPWGAWPRDAAVTRTSKQAGKALRSQGHQLHSCHETKRFRILATLKQGNKSMYSNTSGYVHMG